MACSDIIPDVFLSAAARAMRIDGRVDFVSVAIQTGMRSFFAIQLTTRDATDASDEDVAANPLARAVGELNQLDRSLRTIRLNNLHITLKFLGSVSESSLSRATRILKSVSKRHNPFRLAVHGTGTFPSKTAPRVVWAGVHPRALIAAIASDLENECRQAGFTAEPRAFRPHVTLARVKGKPPECLSDWLRQNSSRRFEEFDVVDIRLMQSRPNENSAEYLTVASARLDGHESGDVPTYER